MKNSQVTYVSVDTKGLSKEIKKFTAELAQDPAAAKAFLAEAGILTPKKKFPSSLQTSAHPSKLVAFINPSHLCQPHLSLSSQTLK
ncbi:hypothetical protein [Chitinophaga sp.]|uniref:hypothetical protein n=1 Tax=Chitinophaga sp. TaxID=1869181 RepID=UPI0031D84529